MCLKQPGKHREAWKPERHREKKHFREAWDPVCFYLTRNSDADPWLLPDRRQGMERGPSRESRNEACAECTHWPVWQVYTALLVGEHGRVRSEQAGVSASLEQEAHGCARLHVDETC